MKIYKRTYGLLQTNTYICVNESSNDALIIDPGEDALSLISDIQLLNAKPRLILLTHGHFDHVYATKRLADTFKIKSAIHRLDKKFLNDPSINGFSAFFDSRDYNRNETQADILLNDGDIIDTDTFQVLKNEDIQGKRDCIKVMHTPGHTQGSVCYILNNVIFSGDTLFRFGYGRTDLYGGNEEQLQSSLSRLFSIQDDRTILCGHGESTTLFAEKRTLGF